MPIPSEDGADIVVKSMEKATGRDGAKRTDATLVLFGFCGISHPRTRIQSTHSKVVD